MDNINNHGLKRRDRRKGEPEKTIYSDSLFSDEGDCRFNAKINHPHDAHELMTEGYLRAGQCVIESLSVDQKGVDFLVYPMVYLYSPLV